MNINDRNYLLKTLHESVDGKPRTYIDQRGASAQAMLAVVDSHKAEHAPKYGRVRVEKAGPQVSRSSSSKRKLSRLGAETAPTTSECGR